MYYIMCIEAIICVCFMYSGKWGKENFGKFHKLYCMGIYHIYFELHCFKLLITFFFFIFPSSAYENGLIAVILPFHKSTHFGD